MDREQIDLVKSIKMFPETGCRRYSVTVSESILKISITGKTLKGQSMLRSPFLRLSSSVREQLCNGESAQENQSNGIPKDWNAARQNPQMLCLFTDLGSLRSSWGVILSAPDTKALKNQSSTFKILPSTWRDGGSLWFKGCVGTHTENILDSYSEKHAVLEWEIGLGDRQIWDLRLC